MSSVIRTDESRQCAFCKSPTTYVSKKGHVQWYRHGSDWWCARCHVREVISPARVAFKGKQVHLSYNPRTGICGLCNRRVDEGEIKVTNLHHIRYHPEDPLKDTIEICTRDHALIHAGKIEVIA